MIKKLASSLREYKKSSIIAPVFITLEALLDVVIPMLMAKLIDFGIDAKNMAYILKMGVYLFIGAILAIFFGIIAGNNAAIASSGFAKNLRHDMYYKVQDFSFSNIDKFSTGGIVTRLTTDVTNLQNAYQMILLVAVRSPAMLVLSLIAAFHIDAHISAIFLIAAPILGVGLFFIMYKVHPIFQRVFRTYDRLNNTVHENLSGIRVVKAFTRESHEEVRRDIRINIPGLFKGSETSGIQYAACAVMHLRQYASALVVWCKGDCGFWQ